VSRWWAPSALRLRVDGLELRLPDERLLDELASLAARGLHDPATMPFLSPWTDGEPDVVARRVLQWQWQVQAGWTPGSWSLDLVVLRDGEVLGKQGVAATDFAVRREVETGSWLGRAHQGRGVGRRMRAAVLAFAFGALDAASATTEAFVDNAASNAVSTSLGYRPDGTARVVRRGSVAVLQRYRLDAPDWVSPWPVEVAGVTDELRAACGAA
jgi:RimJ/RimL family protein N-acetyltransferase